MLSRVRYAALLFVILLLFSLQAGCMSFGKATADNGGPAQNTPSSSNPIQDITSRNPPKVSLQDAMATLTVAEQEGGIDIKGMVIHQVFGYGVDSSGLARTWVLGMQGAGKTTLLSYTEGEWSGLEMPDISLPADEVKIKELITPQDLFRNQKNADLIVREMNRLRINESDLSLSGETYQVTIHAPTESKTLLFNARTGELVSSA
jgi:hypothetical protein